MSGVSIRVTSRVLGDVSIDLDSGLAHFRTDLERDEIARMTHEAAAAIHRAYGIEETES